MALLDIRVPSRVSAVPKSGVDHLLRQFHTLKQASAIPTRDQSRASGVSLSTMHYWQEGRYAPSLEAFQRALNGLGYELQIVRRG